METMNYQEPAREATEAATDAKCPSCGAAVCFDPETGGLKCEYCGYACQIPPAAGGATVEELDFASAKDRESFEWGMETRTVMCKSCGAVSVYDALTAADVCPYCGSNHVMETPEERVMAPGGVVPFKITAKQAEQKFIKWLKRKWFTPRRAKREAKADRFKGIYSPYWTFDTFTTSNYTARYGKDRRVKRGDTYVTVTDWYPTSGVYQEFFDDVLVSASANQDKKLLKRIERFNFAECVPYKPEYVAGFAAERYSLGLDEGWEVCKRDVHNRLDSNISSDIRSRHHADRVSGLSFSTLFQNVTYKYLLVPLWLSSFLYKGKTFGFVVNGQSGAVAGKAPVSALRVIIAVILGIAAIAALYLLFGE